MVVWAKHQSPRRPVWCRTGAHARCQLAAETMPAGAAPGVVPANSLYQRALSGPRTNTTPTPGAGVATPTSPLARPPRECQPDQWAPSVLWLENTVPSVPRASTYSVPRTLTAAGPLPASVRPPRLRQGRTAVLVISLSQTDPSPLGQPRRRPRRRARRGHLRPRPAGTSARRPEISMSESRWRWWHRDKGRCRRPGRRRPRPGQVVPGRRSHRDRRQRGRRAISPVRETSRGLVHVAVRAGVTEKDRSLRVAGRRDSGVSPIRGSTGACCAAGPAVGPATALNVGTFGPAPGPEGPAACAAAGSAVVAIAARVAIAGTATRQRSLLAQSMLFLSREV